MFLCQKRWRSTSSKKTRSFQLETRKTCRGIDQLMRFYIKGSQSKKELATIQEKIYGVINLWNSKGKITFPDVRKAKMKVLYSKVRKITPYKAVRIVSRKTR